METFTLSVGILMAASLAQVEPKSESYLPLPELVIHNPVSGERYSNTSSCAVTGKLSPIVSRDVRVQFLTDGPQGPTKLIGIGNVHVNERGVYAVTVDAPETGWPPFGVRVWVTIPDLPQVKAEVRFNVEGAGLAPVEPIVEPPSSGIVIDWNDLPALPPRVPFGETFIIRGAFTDPGATDPFHGPDVLIETTTGAVAGVTLSSQGFRSLRDPTNATRYLFEAPLMLPQPAANDYTFRVRVMSKTADRREEEFTVIPLSKKLPK